MLATSELIAAYERTDLPKTGISFEAAVLSPMFKRCLERIATASQHIKQPPLPKHQTAVHWQDFKG